tara:strand:+ start:7195 stop:9537 length:2343 start_codon:yes stop_codon:yes gene_type:complete
MRFIFSLILICFFSINSGNALCAAAAASSAGSITLPTEAEAFETTGVRVVRKVPIDFRGESIEIEEIDQSSLTAQKVEELCESELYYINWPGYDKVEALSKGRNIQLRIFNESEDVIEHTFPIKGSLSNAAFSRYIPHGVIQFIENGNEFKNYYLNLITGEMSLWFEGNVHYNSSSFTPDHTALYYIDAHDGENWVFRHEIGETERTPLYNLSTRHPDQTHSIDRTHIILHVDEKTGQVIYTNYDKAMAKDIIISSKGDSGTFNHEGVLQSSDDATTYYHSHEITEKRVFYISNYYKKDHLYRSQIDGKGEISNSVWYIDESGAESTGFALDFNLAIDGESFAVKSRKEGEVNWKIIKFTGKDPSEGQWTYQAHKDTQNILSLKGSRTISAVGPQRFPPTLVETDMASGDILGVLQKPVLPRGLYYPPIFSRTIPSSIDGREVHFLFNLPPLFSGETDQKRPFVLKLGGGPITKPDTAEELRSGGLDRAQKGIGGLFINYRARYGRKQEDVKSMCDEDGQWNDYHIWDVATVLHALQDAGIATEFVLIGGSFDAHTVLALAHGQEPDTGRAYGEGLNITGLVLGSGAYCCDESHDPDGKGRHSRVTFEDPEAKSIPTLALHGMHDWQCEFSTQGNFIREYLKANPQSLFLADPDAEHQLSGNSDIDEFWKAYFPTILEKMALGDADPLEEFRESKLHQSFIDRYDEAIREQERKKAVARRLLDSIIANAVSARQEADSFEDARELIKLRSLARDMVAGIVADVARGTEESAAAASGAGDR